MNYYCQECSESFCKVENLHKHLRSHKLTIESYYVKHYPRNDIYSGSPIVFKDFKQYMSTFFNRRDNMKKWFRSNAPKDEKVKVLERLYEHVDPDKEDLSTVELETKKLPSCFDVLSFLTEDEFLKLINFKKPRLTLTKNVPLEKGELSVFIDTREQDPLYFPDFQIMKLDTGDYGCKPPLYSNLFIERKSLSDLIGTLGSGYDRFQNEISRANDINNYLVVVVESSLENFINHRPNRKFGQKASFGFLSKKLRDLIQKNDNLQFVFVKDREESRLFIEDIFRMKNAAKSIDLQFYYQNKCG